MGPYGEAVARLVATAGSAQWWPFNGERRRGPCPFPGADKTGDRPCAEKAEAAS